MNSNFIYPFTPPREDLSSDWLAPIDPDYELAAMRGEIDTVRVQSIIGTPNPADVIKLGRLWLWKKPLFHRLELEGFTGIKRLRLELDHPVPWLNDYQAMSITGRCGELWLDAEHCPAVFKQVSGRWVAMLNGPTFDESTWDGSDFFMSANASNFIHLATRKLADFISRYRVNNIIYSPVPGSCFDDTSAPVVLDGQPAGQVCTPHFHLNLDADERIH